jgi:hypothetical protein
MIWVMEFEPRINVRVYPVILWDHKPPVVLNDFRMRYGLMPDGSEVELGKTVTMGLPQAFDHYMMILQNSGVPAKHWDVRKPLLRLRLDSYVLPYRDTWLPRHPVARFLALAGARRVRLWSVLAWRRVTRRKTLRIDGYEMAPLPASDTCLEKLGLVRHGPIYILKEGGVHAGTG